MNRFAAFLMTIVFLFFASPLSAEHIFLTNGEIIEADKLTLEGDYYIIELVDKDVTVKRNHTCTSAKL